MTKANIPSELILTNGRVYTADVRHPWVEAVAIAGGQITAVGSSEDVLALKGDKTEIVDLDGRMVMPGLVDVHIHIMMGGESDLFEMEFDASSTLDQICEHVADAVEYVPTGAWLIGNQWGADMLSTLNTTAALDRLDAASKGRAVVLRDETRHVRWVNSEAMRLAGISHNMEDPPGGVIGRDPRSKRLTGMLFETAGGLAERAAANDFTEEMAQAAVRRGVEIVNSFGVTAFQDAATVLPVLKAMAGVDQKGGLTAWAVACLPLVDPGFTVGASGDELIAVRDDYRTRHVRPEFTKIFLDGVPGARTAAFHDAYVDDDAHARGFRGDLLVEYPDLVKYFDKSEKLGMGLKVHCAGDLAVTAVLDAIEVVRHFNGPTTLRHHIAHASYIRPQDIKRFGELGVVADLCPMIWYPTTFLEGHKEAMGDDRAERFWPMQDLLQSGALLAGGSDWPVMPIPNPWQGIEGMVTRQNPTGAFPGVSLWPEQALSLDAAIQAYTINAARAMGLEDVTGSITPGKSADMIVLDRNVFEIPANDIGDTKVLTTYFEGKPIYRS